MAKLSIKEKIGYGLGDTASNIVFQVVINFMMYFYTDVYGISAAAVGTLMLSVRIFDAVTDPVMGGIADRTRTRWGRYRPYLIWIAIPYGILAVLTFTTPDFSDSGKLIYAYITYALLMTAYTAINIPYSALGGVLTRDPQERASVQSWRFALAMMGGAIVTATTLGLVAWFGGDDKQQGFQYAVMLLAGFAVLCFILCFALTKEHVEPEITEQQNTMWADFKELLINDQWRIIALLTLLLLTSVAMRGSVTPYYVTYYLNSESMISVFMTSGMLAGVAGALFANWACQRMCKVKLMKIATLGIVLFNGAQLLVPRDAIWFALVFSILANFFHMIFIPLLFSAIPDTVDYAKKKFGQGAMAMSFSGHLLALKFGIAIGGALAGWTLAGFGYQANVEQSDTSLTGILVVFAASSVVAGLLMLLMLRSYKLDNEWSKSLGIAR